MREIQLLLDARIGEAVESWVQDRSYVKPLVTLEDIAEDVGVPPDQLSVYIHLHENQQVLTWRKKLRIRDARQLLLSYPDLPLSVVGEMVGIQDKSNFKKQFKALVGMSPREWRERFRK